MFVSIAVDAGELLKKYYSKRDKSQKRNTENKMRSKRGV